MAAKSALTPECWGTTAIPAAGVFWAHTNDACLHTYRPLDVRKFYSLWDLLGFISQASTLCWNLSSTLQAHPEPPRTLFCFAWSPRRKDDEGTLQEAAGQRWIEMLASPSCMICRSHSYSSVLVASSVSCLHRCLHAHHHECVASFGSLFLRTNGTNMSISRPVTTV